MSAAQQVQPTGRVVWLTEVPTEQPPQIFADVPDVLTVPQVAELLAVCTATVRREIARGALECVHVGRAVRVTKQQLLAYVEGGAE